MDLKSRADVAASRLGFLDLWDLAEKSPHLPYRDLAAGLDAGLTALDVELVLRFEAHSRGQASYYARDSLCRSFSRHLPEGWMSGPRAAFKTARAFSAWCGTLSDELVDAAGVVWNRLREDPEIVTGWAPSGPWDPVLERAFSGLDFSVGSNSRDDGGV